MSAPLAKRLGTLLVAAACLAVPPRVAFAQSGPTVATVSEAVYLKDGTVIRGRITEVKDGSHVLVALEGGQVARIRWDFVQRIERAPGATNTPAPAPAPASTPVPVVPAPAAATAAQVIVHIDSPEPVRLELMEGRNAKPVCESPCDMPVSVAGTYRIGGSIRASRTFTLSGNHGDRILLTVDPTSRGGFVGGVILVSVGGATFLVAGLVYLVAAAADSISGSHKGSGTKTGAGIAMGLGIGALVGGIVLIATNGSSKVEQTRNGAAPASTPEAKVRLPDFGDRDPFQATLPSAATLPFTVRF